MFLFFRQSPAAAVVRDDDEVPGNEVGTGIENLQHHRQAEGQEAPADRMTREKIRQLLLTFIPPSYTSLHYSIVGNLQNQGLVENTLNSLSLVS